jgi:arginyl-tRNA synthetase
MKRHVLELVRDALHTLQYPVPEAITCDYPKVEAHGDISTNVAMLLTKELKQPPKKIAESIVGIIKQNAHDIRDIQIAGPGFINFFFNDEYFTRNIKSILNAGDRFGRIDILRGKKANVEFVSANPTGPLTVGHGRNAVIGDTIANFLEWAGCEKVDREYYFNNAGRQMRMLGDSVRLRYLELLGEPVEFPGDYYQGEYIRDIAQSLIDKYGDSIREEPPEGKFKEAAEASIFAEIRRTCDRLGIRFDHFYNEKSLYDNGYVEEVISLFREKNLAYDKDGAIWLKTSELGLEQDRVIVKSTGEPTYRLPDIAYHREKFRRGYDMIIDILGADHHATYPDVLAGIKALGFDESRMKLVIYQFVTVVREGQPVKMSTRKANYITLDELMDEAGPDVVRYFFLMRSPQSHLNFDLDLARKETDENPVYYLQYAHARIASILRFAVSSSQEFGWIYSEGDERDGVDLSLLTEKEEIGLAKRLEQFPEIVELCAINCEPHHMGTYLTDVAMHFHKFYHAHRVITGNRKLSLARLSLCRATMTVIGNGLKTLGISAPERM